jgi:hypothetical protein
LLHVTNGDLAVAMLRQAGMAGEILPWRDVLHEGPVRGGLPLDELSAERARFIAEAGWAPYEVALENFAERDERLRRSSDEDEVVLWFEHDLYDQLQLIQVLDLLAEHRPRRLTLVCEAEYLGPMAPSRAAALFLVRADISERQVQAARRAWAAFRMRDPRAIPTEIPELPFLGAAMYRLLEEYPWTSDGLSRLERGIVRLLKNGPLRFAEVFRGVKEEPNFLGDTVLLWHLRRLERDGVVECRDSLWRASGRPLARQAERWLGGVRALPEGRWRFDPALGRVVE